MLSSWYVNCTAYCLKNTFVELFSFHRFFFEFLPLSLIYDPTFCLFIQQSYIPVRLGIDGEMLPGDVRVLREPGEGPPLTHQDQGTGQSHPNMQ